MKYKVQSKLSELKADGTTGPKRRNGKPMLFRSRKAAEIFARIFGMRVVAN